jgi:hypothetical protein
MEKLDMSKLWTPEFIGNQDGFLESMPPSSVSAVASTSSSASTSNLSE